MEAHETELLCAAEELTGLRNPYPNGVGEELRLTEQRCRSLAADTFFYHTLLCVAEAIRRALNHNLCRDEFQAHFIAPYARSSDREVEAFAQRLLRDSAAVLRGKRRRAVSRAMYHWAD